jgi:kynurenine formamidase
MIDAATLERERDARQRLATMSNWGRWGDADEIGAVNLVNSGAVRRGLASVSAGRVYSLTLPLDSAAPMLPTASPPRHYMRRDRGDAVAQGPGDVAAAYEEASAVDDLLVAVHGNTCHVDGLSHVWSDDTLYNGFPASEVRSDGAAHLGMEHLAGIVTRGVLIDAAGQRGVRRLSGDDLVTVDEVTAFEAASGVRIQPGDAVLVHTGWPTMFAEDPDAWARRQPGVGASAAFYLAERDICLLGADNTAVEPWSGMGADAGDDPRAAVAHLHGPYLRNLGIYLLENLELSALAAAGVTAFLFCLAPLRIRGGTGSPVNPLAVA